MFWSDKSLALISDFELKRKAHHWRSYICGIKNVRFKNVHNKIVTKEANFHKLTAVHATGK
jgi:hypothetical protein